MLTKIKPNITVKDRKWNITVPKYWFSLIASLEYFLKFKSLHFYATNWSIWQLLQFNEWRLREAGAKLCPTDGHNPIFYGIMVCTQRHEIILSNNQRLPCLITFAAYNNHGQAWIYSLGTHNLTMQLDLLYLLHHRQCSFLSAFNCNLSLYYLHLNQGRAPSPSLFGQFHCPWIC